MLSFLLFAKRQGTSRGRESDLFKKALLSSVVPPAFSEILAAAEPKATADRMLASDPDSTM